MTATTELQPVTDATPQSRSRAWVPAAFAVIATVAIALIRLIVNPRFYFADDTQLGSIGIWRRLGELAAEGRFPIIDPHAWQAGNYFAEGQWGLLNPLSWLIGIGSLATPDVLVYVTAVKVAVLGLFALGVFLLARSYGASPWWSAAAAVMVPAAGFTAYMDAPSWVSGLLNAAAFAFTWWGVRLIRSGRSPLAYLVSAYLLITFGYIFGVLMLVALLVLSLGEAALRRRWDRLRALALASAFGALLTITVYLPGVLTAGVTERGTTEIIQAWFLSADLSDFGGLIAPTASMSIGAWWGPVTHSPIMSISWALPLIPALWGTLRRSFLPLLVPIAMTVVVALIIVGPSHVGPLRWPVRFLPYLAIAVAIVWACTLTRGFPGRLSRRGLLSMVLVTAALGYLAWTQTPTAKLVVATLAATLIALIAIHLIGTASWIRLSPGARSVCAAALVIAGTVSVTVPQLYEYRYTPLGTFATPNTTPPMESVLADGVDDGFVVGDVYAGVFDPASFEELLVGNLWYYSPTAVSNLYTVLPYTTFSNDLCIDLRGATCPQAFDTLMSVDATTGETVADLLGINTVVAVRSSFDQQPTPGAGWQLTQNGRTVWVFQRTAPVPTAGGVTYVSDGTSVEVTEQSETTVQFRVEQVGSDPQVVLSRLAYPGYTVDGARQGEALRGYLLSVDLSGVQPGESVTVSFRPPGWTLELTSLLTALLLGIAWPIVRFARRRHRSADAHIGSSRLGSQPGE